MIASIGDTVFVHKKHLSGTFFPAASALGGKEEKLLKLFCGELGKYGEYVLMGNVPVNVNKLSVSGGEVDEEKR